MKVSPEIMKLIPYAPGKPIEETKREFGVEDVVKLASNENPLGPSPKVLEAISKAAGELHRYPDASAYHLAEKCREKYGFTTDRMVFGNGSNELIDLLIRVFCRPGDQIVTTQSAFIAYRICAQAAGVGTVEIPYDGQYGFDMDALEDYVEKQWSPEKKLIFIPNPNNPTGSYIGAQRLNRFLEKVGGRDDLLIVFDEAYHEFVRHPDAFDGLEVTKKYENVVTLRTLSKVYGLAGLRVGILFGGPEICDFIHRVRMPFNVSSLAQAAAVAALDDEDYIERSRQVNWQGLDYFYEQLKKMSLPFVESQGNFVFFDTLRSAAEVSHGLLRRGVILRPLKGYGFERHLRMSVGLPEENQKAIFALNEVLKGL